MQMMGIAESFIDYKFLFFIIYQLTNTLIIFGLHTTNGKITILVQ